MSSPDPTPSVGQTSRTELLRHKFWARLKLTSVLYLLCLPTIGSLLVFSYYPKFDVVLKSFFRWSPPSVEEFIGFSNFITAASDQQFWYSFKLVGILLCANLVKLWPGIFAAIALHRLASDRLRYIYQVLFVVPMIIPGMVWLLIWKSFYDPDFGLLNQFLNATGLMGGLQWLDQAMPVAANALQPVISHLVNPVFGGLGGIFVLGAFILAFGNRREREKRRFLEYAVILAGSFILPIFQWSGLAATPGSVLGLLGVAVLWMIGLARVVGKSWVMWPFLLLGGTLFLMAEPLRLPLILLVSIGFFELMRKRFSYFVATPWINGVAYTVLSVGAVLVVFGAIWTDPINQFAIGKPAWLGSPDLVIPSLIFWGFPWVGTVGVLIYLSGLQNISQDVYEAATLDGVGPAGMIWHIELPLIMTQVRINLIFMTIGTLTTYEMFLILLGPEGGPGNKGMVPGLYMFSTAFSEGKFGYACAMGMVLFVIILLLTIVYQRYVKVDK